MLLRALVALHTAIDEKMHKHRAGLSISRTDHALRSEETTP